MGKNRFHYQHTMIKTYLMIALLAVALVAAADDFPESDEGDVVEFVEWLPPSASKEPYTAPRPLDAPSEEFSTSLVGHPGENFKCKHNGQCKAFCTKHGKKGCGAAICKSDGECHVPGIDDPKELEHEAKNFKCKHNGQCKAFCTKHGKKGCGAAICKPDGE